MEDDIRREQTDALRAQVEAMDKLYDDRFRRDMERLKMLEDIQREQTVIMTRQTEISGNMNKIITDHEARIRSIEEKPRKWTDKVLTAVISVVVSTLIAALIYYIRNGG